MPGAGPLIRLARHSRARAIAQWTIIGLILLGFGVAVAREWDQVQHYRWQVAPAYLLGGILLTMARGPVVLEGWREVLARLGYRLRWTQAVRVYFTSGMAKYLPGSLWFAVGRVLLAEQAGVPKRVSSVSIGLETALIIVAAMTASSLGLTALAGMPIWPYLIVLAALLVFLLWPAPFFALLNWGLVRAGFTAVDVRLGWRDLAAVLPAFLANWLVYGLISYCWTAAVYPGLAPSDLPGLTGLFAAAWVVGFLAVVVPLGVGVREGIVVTGLIALLHLPLAAAGAAAVLSRLGSILGEALWAGIAIRLKPRDQGQGTTNRAGP